MSRHRSFGTRRLQVVDDPDVDLPSNWAAWRDAMEAAWAAWPAGVVVRIGISLASSAADGIGLGYTLKRVIEGVAAGNDVRLWVGLLIAFAVAPRWLGVVWDYVQHVMLLRTQQLVRQRMMTALTTPVGVDHLESPRYADRVSQLMRGAERMSILFDWLASQAGSGLALIAAGVALGGLHGLLVVPILLAAVLGLVLARSRRQALALMDRATAEQRLGDKLMTISTSARDALDVRMLGLPAWLVANHRVSRDKVGRELIKGEQRVVAASTAAAAAQAVALSVAVGFLVRLAIGGDISAGDVAMGIVVLQSSLTAASGIGRGAADLARNTFVARRYSWLARHRGAVSTADHPRSVPTPLVQGIQIEDVSFSYPGSDEPVLRNVSLRIAAGSTVAFVGDNGAGKSTLVKLLCRFYDPTSGRIAVDGVDLRDLSPQQWRGAMTGAFQDFERYEFTAGESVGVGDVPHVGDNAEVERAARAGGADTFIELWPERYATQLGREYGGEELSEGQWQKVAIARGSMRADPLVVLLDEPTAALDPQAEHDLFERHIGTARAARERGGITIVVSHRFSTVRMADVIVVMEHGAIVETGTHDELVAHGGRYAELYELQAARYR